MRFKIGFFLLLWLSTGSFLVAAQKPNAIKQVSKKPAVLAKDSSAIQVRKFDENPILTYAKHKDFIYDDVPQPSVNWWQRFWKWFWSLFDGALDGKNYGPLFKFGLIALVIGLVTFLIIKILGLDLRILTGKSKKVEIAYEESLENIHEINFDDQLEIAISQQNYRLAVRLLYLRTLKSLTDRELIFWQPEKTNQTYVAELANEQYKNTFHGLTNQFEYIWYGEFNIDKSVFNTIQESFHQFNQQMR